MSATRVQREQHECNTSETLATLVRHKCDTSTIRTIRVQHEWKILALMTTREKTDFHTLVFTIWQVKNYKERDNFIFW